MKRSVQGQGRGIVALLPGGVLKNMALALLCAVLLWSGDQGQAKGATHVRSGVVNRIVDGDTVWVNSNDTVLKLRLIGMDAPEICQPGGPEAREVLKRRIEGQLVTITFKHLDNYGRLLARVEHDGEDLGRWMVRQGHAWSDGYRNAPGPYGTEQLAAMNARLGLFSRDAPEIPRKFRRRHGSCFQSN